MRIKGAEVDPWQLGDVPGHFKTQEIRNEAVHMEPYALRFVPDWFVMQGKVKLWHHGDDYFNDDELIKWYLGHKKRKTQKAKMKDKLMPIAWHPSKWQDWSVPENAKKQTEKLWW